MADRDPRIKIFLFHNDRATSDTHPSKTGNGEIDKEMLRFLNEKMKESPDGIVKLYCAGWYNESKSGKEYLRVNIEVKREGGSFRRDEPSEDIPF